MVQATRNKVLIKGEGNEALFNWTSINEKMMKHMLGTLIPISIMREWIEYVYLPALKELEKTPSYSIVDTVIPRHMKAYKMEKGRDLSGIYRETDN